VRGLRQGGYEPWFAAYEELTFAARSRSVAGTFMVPRPSESGDEAYVEALADAAARCRADVVLPCNELALKAVAAHRDGFPDRVVVGSLSRETVDRATDKLLLARLAGEVGLSAPPALGPGDPIEFPVIVKSAQTAVREGDRTTLCAPSAIVHDAEALRACLAEAPSSIVQPFLAGTLVAVSGVAWEGEVVCSVHQVARRIFPQPIGVSAYAQTVPADERIGRPLAEILRRLGWSGIFELQLLRSADNAYVIDLNPRPYGSLALAIAAGLNLPAIWVDLLLGREPRVGRPRAGVRYRAESREVKTLVQALRGRRLRQALEIARPRRRTVHAIFSLRDPAPVLVALALMRAGRKARLRTSSCATGTSTTPPASSPSTASGSWSKAA
jgi:predicted ATP-grasp superfamily ATP-dependent carboligase